jgi:hypothetical protein
VIDALRLVLDVRPATFVCALKRRHFSHDRLVTRVGGDQLRDDIEA